MTYDPAKVYFITSSTVDKILYESPVISGSYAGFDPVSPALHDFSVLHTQGESVIVNGMYSINGSDYYPCGLRIAGAPSGLVAADQYLLCDMYADASNVYVYIANGFDTTQTVYVYYTLESLS
jgi:hypothetical protein